MSSESPLESPQNFLRKSSESPWKVPGKSLESPQKVLKKLSESPQKVLRKSSDHSSSIRHHQSSIISHLINFHPLEQGWMSQSSLISKYDHRQQQTDNRQSHGHSCRGLPFGVKCLSAKAYSGKLQNK